MAINEEKRHDPAMTIIHLGPMTRLCLRWFTRFLMFAVFLPIGVGTAIGYAKGWPEDWRAANWSSSGLLPKAESLPEPRVYVLAARTGRWKSIFAEHMAIVLKAEGATRWTRYDVVGWGNPVRRDAFAADAWWYGNRPYVVASFSGAEATALIPRIENSIARYPNSSRGSYVVWPGPNSNSFVAWVVRHTEGFAMELPAAAVGKDYLGSGMGFGPAASGTGLVVSAWGVLGFTAALEEGIELNLLGAAIGIDPGDLAIKLPALGKLSLFDLAG